MTFNLNMVMLAGQLVSDVTTDTLPGGVVKMSMEMRVSIPGSSGWAILEVVGYDLGLELAANMGAGSLVSISGHLTEYRPLPQLPDGAPARRVRIVATRVSEMMDNGRVIRNYTRAPEPEEDACSGEHDCPCSRAGN